MRRAFIPPEWYAQDHGWADRMAAYLPGATQLFIDAASAALADAGLRGDQVDTVVTVSSTDITTPTLEAQAACAIGFRADVSRVPVFHLGCAGGLTGLSIARGLALAEPDKTVLLVAVETCSLPFRTDRLQKADIIATVLFGDGAAAAVLRAGSRAITLDAGQEHMRPDTSAIMGWDVDNTGLGVLFERSIPEFVLQHFRGAVTTMLVAAGEPFENITRFVCHPGGAF